MSEQADSATPTPVTTGSPVVPPRFTARLADLDELPVAEHADVYQSVHTELQAALAEIDGR